VRAHTHTHTHTLTHTLPSGEGTEKRKSRKKKRNAKQQPEHLETSKRGSCSGAREKHVQLGEAGARRPQQGRRDVPDGDGGAAEPLPQEAAAAGGDIPLPRLPLPGAGGRGLPEQAHGAAGGPVLHRENHLHQVSDTPPRACVGTAR